MKRSVLGLSMALLLASACGTEVAAPTGEGFGPPHFFTVTVTPELIIDTGPGGAIPGPVLVDGSPGFTWQWLAGRITLATDQYITSLAGWMRVFVAGDLLVSIKTNVGGVPGSVVHSRLYSVATTANYQWVEFTEFNQNLDPGTYWVTFEPVYAGGFIASMPHGAAAPLDAYAWMSSSVAPVEWRTGSFGTTPTMGFRVSGVPTPLAMISELQAAIASYNLEKGTATSLNSKLIKASAAFGLADIAGTCAYLQDAINFTRAQSGKKISVATANSIIADLTAIRTELGC